tara:strand:- start:161 stop:403 length:243 start_codon:yes stop_codon:yes gene_type:complete
MLDSDLDYFPVYSMHFRKLSKPYEGSSREEFVCYIQDIYNNNNEIINELKENNNENTAESLGFLFRYIEPEREGDYEEVW